MNQIYMICLFYLIMKGKESGCLHPTINISIIQLPQKHCSIQNQIILPSRPRKNKLYRTNYRTDKTSLDLEQAYTIQKARASHDPEKKQCDLEDNNAKRDNNSNKIVNLLKVSSNLRNKSIDRHRSNKELDKRSATPNYYTNHRLSLTVKSKRITYLYQRHNHVFDEQLKPQTISLIHTDEILKNTNKIPASSDSNLCKSMIKYLNEKNDKSLDPIYSTISISSTLKHNKELSDRQQFTKNPIKTFSSKSRRKISMTTKQPLRPWSRTSAGADKLNSNLIQQGSNLQMHTLEL